jgi:hypothetical protein
MRFLYWNVNGKRLLAEVVALAYEHDVDVLVLSECGLRPAELLLAINRRPGGRYRLPFSAVDDPVILLRLPGDRLRPLRDAAGLSFRWLRPILGPDILLVVCHLPSKLYQSEHDQGLLATRVARTIDEVEAQVGHSRTVLIGDLNMDPFEFGVVGAEGLHGMLSRAVAAKGSRRVGGEDRAFFYNPMWGLFGDRSPGPPGTYYYASSTQVCLFWHMFDQVLIRPQLLDFFDDESLRIIDSSSGVSLLTPSGMPDRNAFSDHLPVVFSLDLAKGVLS